MNRESCTAAALQQLRSPTIYARVLMKYKAVFVTLPKGYPHIREFPKDTLRTADWAR